MANQPSKQSKIKPGTPEMENYLGIGYGGMTVRFAREIIAARKEDSGSYPYSKQLEAEAFLAAYNSTPVAISTRIGSTLPKPEAEAA